MNRILLFCLLFLFLAHISAQTKWDYPVKPGSDEWEKLLTHAEMVKVCNIPQSVIESISTDELADLCINYPISVDFFAYKSMQEGFDSVSEQFNGLRELVNRKDALHYLANKLSATNKQIESKDTPKEALGNLIIAKNLIELFCMQNDILRSGSSDVLIKISEETFKILLLEEALTNVFNPSSVRSSAKLLYSALCELDNSISESLFLRRYFKDGIFYDTDAVIEELGVYYMNILK